MVVYHHCWEAVYLESVGFDDAVIEESGLRNKKTGRDYLPAKCFIYPHYVRGRASHFTFKDPGKRLAFQLPKKYSLNGWTFYNQDSIKTADTVVVVEGENDLISTLATRIAPAVIGTIGQISNDQLEWMRENLSNKRVVTIFDPDEAGNKYRIKVEKNRRFFKNLIHVLPPDDKDIDDLLCGGAKLNEIIRDNKVEVDLSGEKEEAEGDGLEIAWEGDRQDPVATPQPTTKPVSQAAPAGQSLKEAMASNGLALPEEATVGAPPDDDNEEYYSPDKKVIQKYGCYWRVQFKDGVPTESRIGNFTMRLLNVFLAETGDRYREVVMIRSDGYRSEPFMVDDDTKVKVQSFKVLAARMADATFTGSEGELAAIWEIVSNRAPAAEVKIPMIVGRHEKHKAWIFRNKLISDTGVVVDPDENGIFWMHGRSVGIRPTSLSKEEGGEESSHDIPALMTDLSVEEKDELVKGIIENVGRNLNSLGKAITMVAWTYSSVYSNFIFEMNRGFPFLFFWGVNGQGKTTVAKWITQDFYGINGHGSTSVPNLRSGVGWARKAEYYASIPLFIDEVRSDETTKQYLGQFRAYYDREARTMGTKDSFGVRNIRPKAVFVFNGEDQFDDPATRERCIPIRIPVKDRELQESYKWMEARKHLFTGILYHWLLEFSEVMRSPEEQEKLRSEIRALDKDLHAAGCSQRNSKNWAAVGLFGMRLAEKYFPGFDYKSYLTNASMDESSYQKSDTTLMQFWELVEGARAQEMSKITDKHIMREDNLVHIWYPAVFKLVQDDARGKFPFSKNAVLSAIREEPYFVSSDRKVSMGLDGTRRVVLTLDLTKAPDSVRNIALAN
jgi:5S rRNA maturation endonuclease (ribonuclease M5)